MTTTWTLLYRRDAAGWF